MSPLSDTQLYVLSYPLSMLL